MSVTQTETVGMSKNFLKMVDEAKPLLEAGGLRTTDIKTVVTAKMEKAVDLNAKQELKKRELREITIEVEAATDDLYRTVSGFLDASIGVAGKGSVAAKNFQRLRSRVRMPGDQTNEAAAVEPINPVPQPAK